MGGILDRHAHRPLHLDEQLDEMEGAPRAALAVELRHGGQHDQSPAGVASARVQLVQGAAVDDRRMGRLGGEGLRPACGECRAVGGLVPLHTAPDVRARR
jgi:hypothetical protein